MTVRVFHKPIMLCSTLVVAGCALPPDSVSKEQIESFNLAVSSIGCKMVSEADYLPVELQTGLTRQQALDIGAFHLAKGNAEELPNGGFKLTIGECA